MFKRYKVEINPTSEQIQKINQTMGVCRFIYNFYITKNKEIYEETKKFMSRYEFQKWLNNDFIPNNSSYNWIKEVSSKSVAQSILNADKAFRRFFKKQSGFPKYKKRNHKIGIYFVKNNEKDFTIERHKIKIPTLKFVKLKEYGYIPLDAKVKSGTITKEADRYFISVLCEVDNIKSNKQLNKDGIGIDLGIKIFVTSSNDKSYKNINKTQKIKKLEKKLRREQRRLSRKKEKSNKRKNQLRVQRLHYKLSCIRKEYVRFVVNSLVKDSPQFITIEDLNVKGMMKNRHLSKAISQSNFYYFKEFLIYQCNKYGIEVRIVNRFFPSSKICSDCGCIKKDLKLSDRIYKCDCGFEIDRDLNASINLKNCKTYKIA